MKLEMFIDSAYYDMWCVKPVDMKDFNSTLHYDTEKEAGYAKQSIERWMRMSAPKSENTNVFFVFYQEKDFAGHVGGTVWDGMYDSREKAEARLDELHKLEWVEHADYEMFDLK